MSIANFRTALNGIGAATPAEMDALANALANDATFAGAMMREGRPVSVSTFDGAALNALLGNTAAGYTAPAGSAATNIGERISELLLQQTHAGAVGAPVFDAMSDLAVAHSPALATPLADGLRVIGAARPAGAPAVARAVNSKAQLTEYLNNGTIGGTRSNPLTGEALDHAIYGEYNALNDQALNAFAPRNVTPPGGGTPSTLRQVADDIRSAVDAHERTMGTLEGTLPKKELDRIVKDHLRELKQSSGQVVVDMSEAVRAHKAAATTLAREHVQWTRELNDARRTAMDAIPAVGGNLATEFTLANGTSIAAGTTVTAQQRQLMTETITGRFNNIQNAANSMQARQLGIHERALEDMKGIVEVLEENGIKLKKSINFEIGEKAIVNKTESAAGHAAEGAAGKAEHLPPAPKGHMMGIGIGAVAGATAAHFMKGEDNDSIMPEVFGGVAGGIVGRIVSGFRRGSEVAMGSLGRASELAPDLATQAMRHI